MLYGTVAKVWATVDGRLDRQVAKLHDQHLVGIITNFINATKMVLYGDVATAIRGLRQKKLCSGILTFLHVQRPLAHITEVFLSG